MSNSRQFLRGIMGAVLPASRFMLRGPRHLAEVALTFDDGPHPETTPRLLDALALARISATFFVLGRNAERHPGILSRIVHEGHAIGHHSWTHSEPADTSAGTLATEALRTIALIKEVTGITTDRFRPPKGQLTAAKCLALWRLRQRIILWSADPRDYAMAGGDELASWARAAQPSGGEIVLLHDVHPWAAGSVASFASWRDRGHQFVTIGDWLPGSAS